MVSCGIARREVIAEILGLLKPAGTRASLSELTALLNLERGGGWVDDAEVADALAVLVEGGKVQAVPMGGGITYRLKRGRPLGARARPAAEPAIPHETRED